jgi:hypothetical protein
MADDSFASFSASSYRRLLGQLFALTGDLPEAENVLKRGPRLEAYARAFVRWPRVGAYDRPEAWVRRGRDQPGRHGRPVGGDLRCTTSTSGWSGSPPKPPATPFPPSRR